MQKLDSKRLAGALKQIESAAKAAVKTLNEQTEGEFVGSSLEKAPFDNIGLIVGILKNGIDQATKNARYDGMDDDQIAEAQTAERESEKESLQQAVQEKLAKRQPAPVEVEPEKPDSTDDGEPVDPDAKPVE